MADDRVVTVTIKSEYDGKGEANAKKGLKDVEKQAQQTGKTAQEAGQKGENGFNAMATGVGKALAAFAAAKGILDFFSSSVTLANENARAVNTLAAAYQAVGYTADGAMKQAQEFATKMQNLTGIADEAFLNAQRLLANYGVVGTKAQEAIQAAYSLSIGKSMDFASAMDLVSKAAAGQTTALTRYGIQIDKNTESGEKFDAVLAQINDKFGATAQAAMGDMISRTNALKQAWGDFKEQIGAGLNDGLSPAVNFLTKSVGWLNQAFKSMSAGWGVAFDWLMTAIHGVKAGFLTLGEYAVKSFSPIVKLLSYVPGIGDNIQNAFNEASNSLSQMAENARTQTVELARMSTPLSAILETEKAITEEQQNRLDLQAEEINSRVANEQAAQEQLTEAVREGVEERKAITQQAIEEEQQKETDLSYLKRQIGLIERKEKKSNLEGITSMLRQGSKEQMAVQKAQGMAQAAISAYQAANSAYAALAPIPIIGPALGAAAAAAAIAYGLNNVAQISGVKLAEGGLVKAVTGGVPAVVGEGGSDEAVLPLDNQKAMQRIGGAIAEQSGATNGVVVNINVAATGGVEAILDQLTDAARNGTVQALEFANLNFKVGQSQQGYSV
jgi:hypothetical protein